MSLTQREAARRVHKGATWLDLGWPDWADRVNLDTLDLGDPYSCILPQVFRAALKGASYWQAVETLNLRPSPNAENPVGAREIDLGFFVPNDADWPKLELAWRREILKRRSTL